MAANKKSGPSTGFVAGLRVPLSEETMRAVGAFSEGMGQARARGNAIGRGTTKEGELKGAIAGGGEDHPPKRRRTSRTSLDRVPGRRAMKEYPVTGEELLTLGILQGGTAVFLAFAGACFGFYLSVRQTIDFAGKDVPQATVGWWSGIGDGAFYLSIVTVILGFALAGLSGFKVYQIMRKTDHG